MATQNKGRNRIVLGGLTVLLGSIAPGCLTEKNVVFELPEGVVKQTFNLVDEQGQRPERGLDVSNVKKRKIGDGYSPARFASALVDWNDDGKLEALWGVDSNRDGKINPESGGDRLYIYSNGDFQRISKVEGVDTINGIKSRTVEYLDGKTITFFFPEKGKEAGAPRIHEPVKEIPLLNPKPKSEQPSEPAPYDGTSEKVDERDLQKRMRESVLDVLGFVKREELGQVLDLEVYFHFNLQDGKPREELYLSVPESDELVPFPKGLRKPVRKSEVSGAKLDSASLGRVSQEFASGNFPEKGRFLYAPLSEMVLGYFASSSQ